MFLLVPAHPGKTRTKGRKTAAVVVVIVDYSLSSGLYVLVGLHALHIPLYSSNH